ncbi:MAG: hypothetical protein KIS29_11340 [Thermoplasmata archaeon]|nr:hypothetical protein [Candidatus Sysuiplasma jiujiangense]
MTMRILKRALSLFIVGLFVFTAFAVIQSGGNQAQASPSASSSFTFPYQYGTPTVPSDVGAQGIQGLTVPKSDIGLTVPQSSVGAPSTVGEPNPNMIGYKGNMPKIPATLNLTVLNGTKSSNTPAIFQTVLLQNITTGIFYPYKTSASGTVSISTYAGWYWMFVVSSVPSSYVNYTQQVLIPPGSSSRTVYLIPSSYVSSAVDNPSSSLGTIYFNVDGTNSYSHTHQTTQITVQLLNDSSGGAYLTSAITGNNGTAIFTHVSTAYSYGFDVIGYNQSLTNTMMYEANFTVAPTSAFSGNIWSITGMLLSPAEWKHTATIVGSSPPVSGGSAWSLSVNTSVTGGYFYISNGINVNGHSLFFNDTVVYDNVSINDDTENIYLFNSTFISLSSFAEIWYGGSNDNAYNSTIFGSFYHDLIYDGVGTTSNSNDMIPPSGNISGSIIKYFDSSAGVSATNHWEKSVFENITSFLIPDYVSNSTFYNYTVGARVFSPQWKYDRFINSSIFGNINGLTMNITESIFGSGTTFNFATTNSLESTFEHNLVQDGMPTGDSLAYFSSIGFTYFTFTQNTVVEYNNFTYSAPPLAPLEAMYFEPNDSVSNNIFYYVDSPSVIAYWDNNTHPTSYNGYGFMPPQTYINSYVNFFNNYIDGGFQQGFILVNGNHINIHNNYFTGIFSPNTVTGTWGSSGQPIFDDNYDNNTWSGDYVNLTFMNDTKDAFNGGGLGGTTGFYMTYESQSFYINFTHNTIYTFRGGYQGGFAVISHVSNVTWNIFYNNESYGPNAFVAAPPSVDIGSAIGFNPHENMYVANNWFMNLNNLEAPIYTEQHTTNLTLFNNHFYYRPLPSETNIPSYYNVLYLSGKGSPYSMWIGGGTTITEQSSSYQYFFNTSSSGSLTTYGGSSFWYYNLTPDVTIASDTPTISYANGLVGGPQPNFTWKGYNYSESVEPTYIQVGVNSSKAPSVDLQFSGVPGIQYVVQIISHGSEIESFIENASSSGILNATFNPATMPLDPTFEVSPYVAPPPPYNPVQPTPPMNFFPAYVFVILLAASAAGVAIGVYILVRRPR